MSESPKSSRRSLANIATIVAIATLLSKVAGLGRTVAIAAAFGVGPTAGAYNFAYVIPGFLLILLGGINGPFHSAIVSTLAKKKREEIAPIVETVTTLVVLALLALTVVLIVFADPLMHLVAPGLYITREAAQAKNISDAAFQTLQETKAIAVVQFQIMAPMAVLAGLIGIGFGTLNAADQYWLPSISPIFSSVTVLAGLGILALQLGPKITAPDYAMYGGAILAWSILAGAVLQWLVQLPVQWRSGLGGIRPRFDFNRPEVRDVIKVLGPATFSSGMMQINVWTDLFFASFIPNAAAAVSAMGYASLIVQTPLGILSNMILVPLLPVFSRLADPENWDELKARIRQGILITAVAMLPLSALLVALALPIVRLIYERVAFDSEASKITGAVLVAYSVGMFVYLSRDVLVRVFYALGDGDTPFRISIINIFLNALFDFFLVGPFGAPGLVLATVAVNISSTIMMLFVLNRRLDGLNLRSWIQPILGLTVASAVAGFSSWGVLLGLQSFISQQGFLAILLELCLSGLVGLTLFGSIAAQLKVPEFDLFAARLQSRLPSFLRR
ncbi:murein biosynthesis integral membrane protein MurJ [Altericista sp. CCNU0014]|uniref:murein biosynthesis integral membrane protein MurJ n=1 Tax=Altericista sp. CCNU0014 TaxID=3082949 RepID=UPI00384CF217